MTINEKGIKKEKPVSDKPKVIETPDYLTQKLFKSLSYQPIAFGELTTNRGGGSTFSSLLKHKFAITEMQSHENTKVPVQKQYLFVFYFDDKMKVQMAESVSSD